MRFTEIFLHVKIYFSKAFESTVLNQFYYKCTTLNVFIEIDKINIDKHLHYNILFIQYYLIFFLLIFWYSIGVTQVC